MHPEVLGKYKLIQRLGGGAFGDVFLAVDTELNRDVAIKLLHKNLAENPDARQLLLHEAVSSARLQSEYICRLIELGHLEDHYFLVMEYVDGESLAARLNRGFLPVDKVIAIGGQIACALAHAHRKGIIHRDLKPSNIMCSKAGIKLVDFGLAKIISFPLAQEATKSINPMTGRGSFQGTPHYAAPERWEGSPADARTDVFAFGAVLYEMLTARRAFDSSDLAGLKIAIQNLPPQPISSWVRIPVCLDRLVMQCLAKDPEERLESAHDIRFFLQTIALRRAKHI